MHRHRGIAALLVLLVTVPARGHAQGGALAPFLQAVEEDARAAGPARADLVIRVQGPEAPERRFTGVAVYHDGAVYAEVESPRTRLVVSATDGALRFVPATPGTDVRVASGYDRIGETPLCADDFRPFRIATFRTPQIVSETKGTLLVSAAPTETTTFVVIAMLFDRDKRAVLRRQHYERTIGNLVRMRRDTDLVRVAGAWRPGRSEIEEYGTRTITTIEWRWTADPAIPAGLFDVNETPPPTLLPAP
jgi:hypothetical protein